MPKGYIIGQIVVNDPEGYKAYVTGDTPILKAHGARFLVRGGKSEAPEGDVPEGMRHVVFEFDSFEAAKAAYEDPDYQEISLIRKATAESTIILVEGHTDV